LGDAVTGGAAFLVAGWVGWTVTVWDVAWVEALETGRTAGALASTANATDGVGLDVGLGIEVDGPAAELDAEAGDCWSKAVGVAPPPVTTSEPATPRPATRTVTAIPIRVRSQPRRPRTAAPM
jgi:hypothetical protein